MDKKITKLFLCLLILLFSVPSLGICSLPEVRFGKLIRLKFEGESEEVKTMLENYLTSDPFNFIIVKDDQVPQLTVDVYGRTSGNQINCIQTYTIKTMQLLIDQDKISYSQGNIKGRNRYYDEMKRAKEKAVDRLKNALRNEQTLTKKLLSLPSFEYYLLSREKEKAEEQVLKLAQISEDLLGGIKNIKKISEELNLTKGQMDWFKENFKILMSTTRSSIMDGKITQKKIEKIMRRLDIIDRGMRTPYKISSDFQPSPEEKKSYKFKTAVIILLKSILTVNNHAVWAENNKLVWITNYFYTKDDFSKSEKYKYADKPSKIITIHGKILAQDYGDVMISNDDADIIEYAKMNSDIKTDDFNDYRIFLLYDGKFE